jgi:hypothetical protein
MVLIQFFQSILYASNRLLFFMVLSHMLRLNFQLAI